MQNVTVLKAAATKPLIQAAGNHIRQYNNHHKEYAISRWTFNVHFIYKTGRIVLDYLITQVSLNTS